MSADSEREIPQTSARAATGENDPIPLDEGNEELTDEQLASISGGTTDGPPTPGGFGEKGNVGDAPSTQP